MESVGCVNICSLTSTLPVIPYQKLTDLHYLSKGGFGTVFKARHCDWRTTVAIKCLKLDSPVGERERNCLLKEAEVLHKARFNYIIQIFGVCNEPEFFCIVTEYMSNGSLDDLLHEKDLYPALAWPLRLRILYEIALGVNFLHNMTPPLLHHDLKTQNILLDGEFHVKIADFGLSKWRQLSISKGSSSKPTEMGGTVIYMPPEEYEPSKTRRVDVKHDMYSYAIIMWEVLARRIPFEEATNPMQIMFSVLRGTRPDTSVESLPADIPSRDMLLHLMTSGWAANPDERPSFLNCLIELEPMLRQFDEIDVLEAVLEIKRSKIMRRPGCCPSSVSVCEKKREVCAKESCGSWNDTSSSPDSGSCSSQDTNISQPGCLSSMASRPPSSLPKASPPASFFPPSLDPPKPLIDQNNLNDFPTALHPQTDFNIPLKPQHAEGDCHVPMSDLSLQPHPHAFSDSLGPAARWIAARREEVVRQMTEACLNQSLDALLARELLMREDYELVVNKPTRTAKVRQLLDTCDHSHSEDFCRVVVRKLQDNKQLGLQPYPDLGASPQGLLPLPGAPLPVPSAPPLSTTSSCSSSSSSSSYNARNMF